MTFQQARRLLLSFPGVDEGPCYGTPGFRVRGKFLARLKEDGTTLVVKCGDEERDCRMEADPKTFIITDRPRRRYLFSVIHTTTVSLPPAEVLERVQRFFADRVPNSAAFLEKSGPRFVTLRGQGGEEIVISAWEDKERGVTRVRASTLFFDQALDRFFSTLPLASPVEVA